MNHPPKLVLFGGLISTAMGLLLVAVADKVEGLIWFAVPVSVLGLLLIVMWARAASRPPVPDTPEAIAANLPGRWYPFAIVGIVAAQMVWFVIWMKNR